MKRTISIIFLAVFALLLCHQPAGSAEGPAQEMSLSRMKGVALNLYQSQPLVILATVDENGYPQARTMANLRQTGTVEGNVFSADSLDTAFGTSAGRAKIDQVKKNPKASVYIVDIKTYQAVTILGTVEVVNDPEIKKAYWSKAFSALYPKGPTAPNYVVLRFKAEALKVHGASEAPFVSLAK
jgi:general stress protein 26